MIDSTFEERILELEQANAELRREIGGMQRRRRRTWIAGIAIVALVTVAGAASFSGDSFQLLHPTSNKQRISYGANPQGKTAGLKFYDDKGGKQRIFFGHGEEDSPTLQFFAPDGQLLRANLAVGVDNSVGLHLFGRTGKELVVLGITASNQFTLQLHRPDGKNFAAINMPEKDTSGGLVFYDSDEKPRLAVGLDGKDEPLIRFFSADGSPKDLRPQ
jgi:hypothetical protein